MKMISAVVLRVQMALLTLVPLLALLTLRVGGDNTDPFSDGSNLNGNSSLCRVIRSNRNSVLSSFKSQYTATGICGIMDHCASVNCTAEFSRGRVNAGMHLEFCKDEAELFYWVNIPGQWDEPWNHTFSSKNSNGTPERREILGNPGETKPTRWFIKVLFSITHGGERINRSIKYISALSMLQICQSATEASCTNTTLLNFPRLPQSQICEFPELTASDIAEDIHYKDIARLRNPLEDASEEKLDIGQYPSSTRSSRNANPNPWNPEQFHKAAFDRAKKFEPGQTLKASPGDPCSPEEIFRCGSGFSCVLQGDGSGTCQCIPDYYYDKASGVCTKESPSPSVPSDDPSAADSLNSRSYSSAVGAIISILILIAIAAGIYFGTKYNYFSRIRHRIPVLRCWPFRRSQPWEDNVTMVNPLGPSPDDDDPLLL